MKRILSLAAVSVLGLALLGDAACGSNFGHAPSTETLSVTVEQGPVGSASNRLPLNFNTPTTYTIKVEAMKNGALDPTFNGYVRLTSQPGSVQTVSASSPSVTTSGRNVLLKNGVADQVQVAILAPYGNTRIWAEDLGYEPANPSGTPPPECSNGIDDNHNGLIDYPADPGCYAADDNTEDGGTYAAGISDTLYYYIPRIADVNGKATGGTSGTPFPNQAVNINTGYLGAGQYDFSVVVIDVAAAGFYATDIQEDAPGGGGFGSIYAYNFDAPPNMRQCDRLRQLGGESAEFYGFEELNYPTWELEEWDPTQRPCLIPDAHVLASDCTGITNCYPIAGGLATLNPVAAALTRVLTLNPVIDTTKSPPVLKTAGSTLHIGKDFGPGIPCCDYDEQHRCTGAAAGSALNPTCTITSDATDCDVNGDGTIDRTAGSIENTCATACAADIECSEYSNYLKESQFMLVATAIDADSNGNPTPGLALQIQGDGSSDAEFNPVLLKGQSIGSFTGTLNYFSGGSQFTIQARCADDIVLDPNAQPIPADTACVHARTIIDNDTGN